MKRTTLFLAMLFLIGALAPHHEPLRADDESASDFKLRPFNEHLEWDEAALLVRKALKGDRQARAQIEKGGLAYVPLIDKAGSDVAMVWSHIILAGHLDWISAMQSWERALFRPDATVTPVLYAKLKPRFRDAGPQLARAIIHAWRLGDAETLTKLLALEPESKWVKAARGYMAQGLTEKEAIALMLPVFDEVTKAEERRILVRRDFLEEENQDVRVTSSTGRELEVSAFLRADGLPDLREVPVEWVPTGLAERIGALAFQSRDKAFIKEVEGNVAAFCGADFEKQRRYVAFVETAFEGTVPKPLELELFDSYALDSSGPLLGVWARRIAAQGWPVECALAAITAFNNSPDLEVEQRACLRQCFSYPDRTSGILAARAVLAMRDDRLDGYRSVAQALIETKGWERYAQLYREALSKSGIELLGAVAAHMADPVKNAAPTGNRVLGLTVAQRAALLQPFVHADENSAHGGALGVYWLNRSRFLEGRGAVIAAAQCLAAAIVEAAAFSGRDFANANTLAWPEFVKRHLDNACLAPVLEQLNKSYPRFSTILKAEAELERDSKRKPEERIYYDLQKADSDGAPLSDEQLRLLFADLSRSGAGQGVQIAAVHYWKRNDKLRWLQNEKRAQLVSPTNLPVCANMAGLGEGLGYNRSGNYELRTQAALQMALIYPVNGLSMNIAAMLLSTMGTPCVAAGAMFELASRRALDRYAPVNKQTQLGFLFNVSVAVNHWLVALTSAWCDDIAEGWKPTIVKTLLATRWVNMTWDWFGLIADVSLRPEFVRRCGNYLLTRYSADDVNNLLNLSLGYARIYPKSALLLIQRSEELGVNAYGRFVGSQTYIRAKAHLGEVDEAFARYRELRDADVGYPPYLDRHLLAGLTEGNRYQRIGEALTMLDEYEQDFKRAAIAYLHRRCRMAVGKYDELLEIPPPESNANLIDVGSAGEYSALFHEARAWLDKGDFATLAKRAEPFMKWKPAVSIGVYLDAYLLAGIAEKELNSGELTVTASGNLTWLSSNAADRFGQAGPLLDAQAIDVLVGRRKWSELQQTGGYWFWHGSRYPERPSMENGNGFLSEAECEARDPFIRGVLAYLSNRKDKAREYLQACVAKDQRCSHEYHVAQWLLEKRLAPPPAEKK